MNCASATIHHTGACIGSWAHLLYLLTSRLRIHRFIPRGLLRTPFHPRRHHSHLLRVACAAARLTLHQRRQSPNLGLRPVRRPQRRPLCCRPMHVAALCGAALLPPAPLTPMRQLSATDTDSTRRRPTSAAGVGQVTPTPCNRRMPRVGARRFLKLGRGLSTATFGDAGATLCRGARTVDRQVAQVPQSPLLAHQVQCLRYVRILRLTHLSDCCDTVDS